MALVTTRVVFQVSRHRAFPSESSVRACLLEKKVRLTWNNHKAVPDSALSFLVDHSVKSRVARATYGTTFADLVDEQNPEHASRSQAWYMNAAGLRVVPSAFQGILRKVCFESFVKNVFADRSCFCRVLKPTN